jgi:TonB family protein
VTIRRALRLAVPLLLTACGSGPSAPPAPATPAAPAAKPATAKRSAAAQRRTGGGDWGEPDMPKLQRYVRRQMPEVKRCYEAGLQRDDAASGKLTLRFTIAPGGEVRDVRVAASTFRRREVPACVAEVVRRWRTPFRPAEPVDVEYPFRFAPGR